MPIVFSWNVNGFRSVLKKGFFEILFGKEWYPTRGYFGFLPLIAGSAVVVGGAVLLATPISLMLSIFMTEYLRPTPRFLLRSLIELLAGIPSVVYGFIGIIILVPFVRNIWGGSGFGIIPASLVLAFMIMPIITAVSVNAIQSVPRDYRLTIFALGGTKWQSIWYGVLPSASRTIFAGIVLAVGRAIGETMAVLMVLGNTPFIPKALNQTVSALTSTIALDMAYASGNHRAALFSIALMLLILTLVLILIVRKLEKSDG